MEREAAIRFISVRRITIAKVASTIALEADPGDPKDFDATAEDIERALEERRERRARGTQRSETKEQVALRLDKDLLEKLRATGPGWQTRINLELRKAAGLERRTW